MTYEELEKAMANFLDKECRIIAKDHPHANESGRTKSIGRDVLGKPFMIIALSSGQECAVYKGSDLMFFGMPPSGVRFRKEDKTKD